MICELAYALVFAGSPNPVELPELGLYLPCDKATELANPIQVREGVFIIITVHPSSKG